MDHGLGRHWCSTCGAPENTAPYPQALALPQPRYAQPEEEQDRDESEPGGTVRPPRPVVRKHETGCPIQETACCDQEQAPRCVHELIAESLTDPQKTARRIAWSAVAWTVGHAVAVPPEASDDERRAHDSMYEYPWHRSARLRPLRSTWSWARGSPLSGWFRWCPSVPLPASVGPSQDPGSPLRSRTHDSGIEIALSRPATY